MTSVDSIWVSRKSADKHPAGPARRPVPSEFYGTARMDFRISPDVEDYRSRIAAFVDGELIPLEADPASYDAHENIRLDLLEALRTKAK